MLTHARQVASWAEPSPFEDVNEMVARIALVDDATVDVVDDSDSSVVCDDEVGTPVPNLDGVIDFDALSDTEAVPALAPEPHVPPASSGELALAKTVSNICLFPESFNMF